MSSISWSKEELRRLYSVEGKTLQEIGDLFGVSRERVRQMMAKFGLERGYHKSANWWKSREGYHSLEEYIANAHKRQGDNLLLRKFIKKTICSECGRFHNKLHIHHIVYPISSLDDIQILCPSCHAVKHKSKVTFAKQIDLFNLYTWGVSAKDLAIKYNIKKITVYKIIEKIRSNRMAYKR